MTEASNTLALAVIQFSITPDAKRNLARADELTRRAASAGAQVALLPELFENPYFPRVKDRLFFSLAQSRERNRAVAVMSELACELKLVIPVSFFEKAGDVYYNSVAMIDADGACLGVYRKSHVPDGAGYEEKYYFTPGDTGFIVYNTHYGRFGVGICWDQWFCECVRALALQGAELLLFPSAVGSEPEHPQWNTKLPWQRVMLGHAAGNAVPIAAANRIGDEGGQRFFGASFIADHRGEKLAELGDSEEGVAVARLDLEEARRYRQWLGVLSDRRPDLYGILTKKPGR